MDKDLKETLVSYLNILGQTSNLKKKAASSGGSHQMTLNQSSLEEENLTESLNSIHTDYQLTVSIKMELTRRQIGLLLDILNYQAAHFGVNFGMYLALEHLSALLIGQKKNHLEIKDENERRVATVSTIILQSLGDQSLSITEYQLLPEVIIQKLIENKLLMEKRVFGSRYSKWRPENFIIIKTVPLNVKFERVKGTSERYSSYCKGYGESHPSAHYKKTKPSSELDGESEDKELYRLVDIPKLLILTQLEMRAKFLRKGRKA
jgi:ASC-1-like (ASCH) protein